MGACHGGDVIVWLPAAPAPTSCQTHMVQMLHPGNKCQATPAQQPRQGLVAAQWTLPTLHGKALSKGNGGKTWPPRTSATLRPLPLTHSGIECQVHLRPGPSNQTMSNRAAKALAAAVGTDRRGRDVLGRVQQPCKCPGAGDTHHPRPSPSPSYICSVFFPRLTTEPPEPPRAEQPEPDGSCLAAEFCHVPHNRAWHTRRVAVVPSALPLYPAGGDQPLWVRGLSVWLSARLS